MTTFDNSTSKGLWLTALNKVVQIHFQGELIPPMQNFAEYALKAYDQSGIWVQLHKQEVVVAGQGPAHKGPIYIPFTAISGIQVAEE